MSRGILGDISDAQGIGKFTVLLIFFSGCYSMTQEYVVRLSIIYSLLSIFFFLVVLLVPPNTTILTFYSLGEFKYLMHFSRNLTHYEFLPLKTMVK